MTIHSISPAMVQMAYHSAWGTHVRTVPALAWTPGTLGSPGTFATHDGDSIAADLMVESLILAIADDMPPAIVHDYYTIFQVTEDAEDREIIPVYSKRFPTPGTLTGTSGQAQAVQGTISLKTTSYNAFKLVYLDRPFENQWGNLYALASTTQDVLDLICDEGMGWCGRDGARPFFFTNTSVSLNKRLRRRYGMI